MKKNILVFAFMFANVMLFAYSGEEAGKFEKSKEVMVAPCSVTVSMYCEGAGKTVSSTSVSPTGDCTAASTVAQSQWRNDCLKETIRKAILEADVNE